MSDQEIAELYHVSRSTVYRRRSNGLKRLKTLLKERN
ncbi:helix-turn-helix domain-containing protein [Anaerostipes hadrus]